MSKPPVHKAQSVDWNVAKREVQGGWEKSFDKQLEEGGHG